MPAIFLAELHACDYSYSAVVKNSIHPDTTKKQFKFRTLLMKMFPRLISLDSYVIDNYEKRTLKRKRSGNYILPLKITDI